MLLEMGRNGAGNSYESKSRLLIINVHGLFSTFKIKFYLICSSASHNEIPLLFGIYILYGSQTFGLRSILSGWVVLRSFTLCFYLLLSKVLSSMWSIFQAPSNYLAIYYYLHFVHGLTSPSVFQLARKNQLEGESRD